MVARIDKEALRTTFERIDANQDGYIDRREFDQLVSDLDAHLSENESDTAFYDIDKDKDGLINYQELAAWWRFPASERPMP